MADAPSVQYVPGQPDQQVMYRLRVFFQKRGRLAMLSHLELARALERAIRRAKLPYAISQGFSPHMKIAFGAALPVGVGGLHECFDVQLTRRIDPDDALEALKAASVHDLMISECGYINSKAPSASVAFPFATYRAELSHVPAREPIVPEVIQVIRKKKQKDLVVSEFLVGEPRWEGTTVTFELESKPTGSLRPDKFLAALLEDEDVSVVSVMRIGQRAV